MNKISPLSAAPPGRLVGQALLAIVAAFAAPAFAGQTDLSPTPIGSTTAAQTKPNIMMLMDTSGSMGRTHIPDEVESVTSPFSVGYKNSQCNSLYYDRTQKYSPPNKFNGVAFNPPSFANAPYAGFVTYYAAPDALDSSLTDLRARFKAYDTKTLSVANAGDPEQPAYYFVYSGNQVLNYATAPCTDDDPGLNPNPNPFSATGGGTWTKVVVGVNSGVNNSDERQNFANWYSFYRTRISATKSASSLAFTPLADSFRVGFITVQPKDTPTSAAINQAKYLPIAAFDSTQRLAWFNKLFSQIPGGASPTREGLARVGRHYGGKQDGINNGMTGDPLLYSCQQNFTILTTDGYWNTQTETPTANGSFGGPLQLDGQTRVGQQDGDPDCTLADPYCPHPIWDGVAASIVTAIDKSNNYSSISCGTAGRFRTTKQTTIEKRVWYRTSEQTSKHTVQYTLTSAQTKAQTTQTTKTVTQTEQTTKQFVLSTHQLVEEKYKILKSQDQTTKTVEQWQLQTSQSAAQTKQTSKQTVQVQRHEEQWETARTQYAMSSWQYLRQTAQYTEGTVQVLRRRYQTVAFDDNNEAGVPTQGACVAQGSTRCRTDPYGGPARYVDPSTCTQSFSVGPAPDYVKTECTPGPATVATRPVATCNPGTTNSGPPSFVVTTCTYTVLQNFAPYEAPNFAGACSNGTTLQADQAGGFVLTTCSTPASTNFLNKPVASCGPPLNQVVFPTGSPWIITYCYKQIDEPSTPSAACNVGTTTDNSFITTTCQKTIDTTAFTDQACVNDDGTAAPFKKVTCTVTPLSGMTVVDPNTCVESGGQSPDYIRTTCTETLAGPYAAAQPTPVQNCVPGVGPGPTFYKTYCSNPPANNQTNFVASCAVGTVTPTSSPWITTVCTKPIDTSGFAPPCSSSTDANFVKTTCNSVQTMPPTAVDPATCTPLGQTLGQGPSYVNTTCTKQGISSTPVAVCPAYSVAPDFTVTSCGAVDDSQPTQTCTVGTVPPAFPDYIEKTCSLPAGPNNETKFVAMCNAQSAMSSNAWLEITCNPNVLISGPALVRKEDCTQGTSNVYPFQTTTCATAPGGAYPAPTSVAQCTPGTLQNTNDFYICSNPQATNFTKSVLPCSPGSSTDGDLITTTCTKAVDTTDFVAGSTCLADQAPDDSNNNVAITCTRSAATSNAPAPTCTVGTVNSASPFDTTTQCNDVQTDPVVDSVGPCIASTESMPPYKRTICDARPVSAGIPDPNCQDGTDGNGLITTCTSSSGSGLQYSVTTTTTTTTTPYSGNVAAGVPVVQTSSVGPNPVDNVCYASAQTFPAKPPLPQNCTEWPCKTTASTSGGSKDSLADVAQYYYKTDLRTGAGWDNNVKPRGTGGAEDDNAVHQHMTTYVLGLGVSGTLKYQPDYKTAATGDFADLRCPGGGLCNKVWPLWPDPQIDYSDLDKYNDPRSIDDFWHTAVDGRGVFFSAKDSGTVVTALGGLFKGIQASLGTGASDGASSFEPTTGNNFAYSTNYFTNSWTGDIGAFLIDIGTGAVSQRQWSARDLLVSRAANACDDRKIYLMRPGVIGAINEFKWNTDTCVGGAPANQPDPGTLDAAEKAYFGAPYAQLLSQYPFMTDGTPPSLNDQKGALTGPGAGAKLVNFIRGQSGNEGFVPDSLTKLFRTRVDKDGRNILGDIVNSQPVYVKAPFATYQDAGYDGFRSTWANRDAMVYVGANDGMLHAFYADVDALVQSQRGQERWAVIPSSVLPNLYKLADDNYANNHQFFVDGTPVVADVAVGASWKTILVGGLNAGGKGYYALDVTDPVAPKALWEFKSDLSFCPAADGLASGNPGDCNLGFTYGKPVVTKLGTQWVVMVTSGYNNVNGAGNGKEGKGFLYVLDATTGRIIANGKIGTGAGDAQTPSGLAQVNNFVDNVLVNNTTLRAYGGDVLGNIWRFEFGASPSAQLIGTAKSGGNVQPITVRPELAELDGKPMVFVGTGRLLGATDIGDASQQSIYGIVDPLTPGPVYPDPGNPLRAALKPLNLNIVGSTRTASCASNVPADCQRPGGWVVDLKEAGERVNVGMKLVLGTLVVASNVPDPLPCAVGGHSWFNYFDFRTGLAVGTADLSNPNDVTSPRVVSSLASLDSLIVGFNIYRLAGPNGEGGKYVAGLHMIDGSHIEKNLPPGNPGPAGKRISWREIAQ